MQAFCNTFSKRTSNKISHIYLIYILGLKAVENALPQLSTASINVEFVEDPDWAEFKFITKKKELKDQPKKSAKIIIPIGTLIITTHLTTLNFTTFKLLFYSGTKCL